MRTTVIPAQVTTVEDTIAGNLTLTQIMLFIAPMLISTAIYAVLPQKLSFTTYKIPLIFFVSLTFILLALRIKGRLVLNWFILLVSFLVRPHLFVFNKNTTFIRDFALYIPEKKKVVAKHAKAVIPKEAEAEPEFDYESLLRNTGVNVRFTKKGLLILKSYD